MKKLPVSLFVVMSLVVVMAFTALAQSSDASVNGANGQDAALQVMVTPTPGTVVLPPGSSLLYLPLLLDASAVSGVNGTAVLPGTVVLPPGGSLYYLPVISN